MLAGAVLVTMAVPDVALAQASRLGDSFAIPFVPYPQYWPKRFPAIAYDTVNKVYLTVSGIGTVGGAFLTEDAAPVGAPFAIVPGIAALGPSVAYSPDAKAFLVTWMDEPALAIWGQIIGYGAGGVPVQVTAPFLIKSIPGGTKTESAPAVAYSTASQEFLVAWFHGYLTKEYDIRAQRISNTGQLLGTEIPVTADPYWQEEPAIGYNPATDEFYVAWSAEYGTVDTVQAQRVKAGTGALVGERQTLASGPFLTLPRIQYNSATGKVFIVWYSSSPYWGLYGRLSAADGTFDGTTVIPLNTSYFAYDATSHAYNPVSNTFFVVTHSGFDDKNPENFGFEVSALGTPSPAFQVTLFGGPPNYYPQIAANPARAEWTMIASVHNFQTMGGQRIQTATRDTSGGQPPPPPPPPPPQTIYTLTVVTGGQSQVFPNISAGTVRTIQPDATAIPQGSVFAGWTGPADCADGSVTMSADITCTAVLHTVLPAQTGAVWARALDFTGDHDGDLFLYDSATGAWSVAESDGQSGFTLMKGLWTTPNLLIKGADLNGDELTDFVIYCTTSGRWWQAINNGMGGFTYTTATWGPDWTISVGRFNHDPFDDVFVYKPATGEWAITFADGAGGFSIATPVLFNPPTWNVTIVDLNGDGASDLFLYNPTTGDWWKGLNSGTGSFAWSDHGNWSHAWTVKAGDFDGDGRGDIFVYNATWGYWYICLSDTPTAFSYHFGQWSPAWQIHVANLNADAFDDLFVYDPVPGRATTGVWYEYFSTGTGGFTYFGEQFNPASWDLSVSEFNGDGLSDLFIYNKSTGEWRTGLNVKGVNPWQEGGFIWSSPATWSAGLTIMSGR